MDKGIITSGIRDKPGAAFKVAKEARPGRTKALLEPRESGSQPDSFALDCASIVKAVS